MELDSDDGNDDGRPDKLGLSLGCDVGQFEMDRFSMSWLLGIVDNEGFMDGCMLVEMMAVMLASIIWKDSLKDATGRSSN